MNFDLVVTPSIAHTRFFAQFLACHGPQICAGIEFWTQQQLTTKLVVGDGSLWDTPATRWHITDILARRAADPRFAWVQAFLNPGGKRPGRGYGLAKRVDALLHRYLASAPGMLHAWSTGNFVDPAGNQLVESDLWQAVLWQDLVIALGSDPVTAQQQAITDLAQSAHPGLAERIIILAIDDLPERTTELINALSNHHQVHLIGLGQPTATTGSKGSRFLAHYGHRKAPRLDQPIETVKSSTLKAAQSAIRSDLPAPATAVADGSVEIHLSHGPDRQVEVLRDLLCAALSADPSLQPRDILVLCCDLERYAAYLDAALAPLAASLAHPGHQIRASIASTALARRNEVFQLLRGLIELYRSRADSQSLIDLLSNPLVARRFSLTREDHELAERLIVQAGIRWGIDANQRRRNQVQLEQSTWFAGLQRLLLSIAMDELPPTAVKGCTPVPNTTLGDSGVIGKLAEVVSRLRRTFGAFASGHTPQDWAGVLRTAIADLIALDSGDDWMLGDAQAGLADLAMQSTGLTADWDLGDIAGWLDEQITSGHGRPNYGNGSLLITRLGDMRMIEKRLVVLLGLNDQVFPGADEPDGDDLLTRPGAASVLHWTTQRRSCNQQSLVDAVLSASERLVIITQATDPQTGRRLPAPLSCLDLAAALGLPDASWWDKPDQRLVITHGLHPHSASEFNAEPRSFDQAALLGAQGMASQQKSDQVPHWALCHASSITNSRLSLGDLESFYADPARALLRSAGVDLRNFTIEQDTQLPLAPNALQQWPVGKQIFDALLAGADLEAAQRNAWLSGQVLAGELGRMVVAEQATAAAELATQVQDLLAGPSRNLNIHLATTIPIDGTLQLHDDQVVIYRFGRIKALDALTAWLRIVALAAAGAVDQPQAVLLGKGRNYRLVSPGRERAKELLEELILLRQGGLQRIVPLNLAWSAAYCGLFSYGNAAPVYRLKTAMAQADRNWSYFYPDLDSLLAQPLSQNDPGRHDDPSRFVVLSRWLMEPILEALRPWRPGGKNDHH